MLTAARLAELDPFGMDQSTPLWYYVLKEAEVFENGLRLGPVGSRIIAKCSSAYCKPIRIPF